MFSFFSQSARHLAHLLCPSNLGGSCPRKKSKPNLCESLKDCFKKRSFLLSSRMGLSNRQSPVTFFIPQLQTSSWNSGCLKDWATNPSISPSEDWVWEFVKVSAGTHTFYVGSTILKISLKETGLSKPRDDIKYGHLPSMASQEPTNPNKRYI